MADWSLPTLSSTYANFLSQLQARDTDLALAFDGTTTTSQPTGTVRWDSTANRWKKWNGTSWAELTSTYALTGLSTTGAASIGTTLGVTGATTLATATATTPSTADNSTNIATTAYVKAQGYATVASPTFTGTPAAPTATAGTNTTQIATTAFVASSYAPLTGATFSGNVVIPAGTASANGIQVGTGTTYKPGIYSPGTDQLALATAGTGRLFVDSSGNVGVGISAPSGYSTQFVNYGSSVDVAGSASFVNDSATASNAAQRRGFLSQGGGTGAGISVWQNSFIVEGQANGGLALGSYASSGSIKFYTDTSRSERMRLDSSGRLGLGTSSPNDLLHANNGNIRVTNSNPTIGLYGANSSSPQIIFGNAAGTSHYIIYETTDGSGNRGALNFYDAVAATTRVVIDSSGNFGIATTSPTSPLHVNGDALVGSLNSDALAGTRSRIMNGGMVIDQRNTGSSISSGIGAVTYTVDRWYVFATTAAVTAQRVTSSNTAFTNALRVTGAASNAGVSIGQRIEVQNSYDLAGKTVTLSFYAATSASLTLTWKAYYAGAANDFTSKTQSNTGTQATTSTLTKYSATFTLSSSATTGVAIEFTLASLTSGSIDITGVQLELGSVATPFERRSFGQELALCQRYYYTNSLVYFPNIAPAIPATFKVSMRVSPTLTWAGAGATISSTNTESTYGTSTSNNTAALTASAEL